MSFNYDSDDAIPHSPGLEQVVPRATPSPSPPPIVTHRVIIRSPNQNVSSPSSRRRKKSNRRKTQPTQGDWVLIREMDPNQPEIAEQVRERALNSDSGSESDEDEMDEQPQIAEPMPSGPMHQVDAQKAVQTARNALNLVTPILLNNASTKNEMPPPSHRDSGVDVEHANKANLGVDTSALRKTSVDADSAFPTRNGDGPLHTNNLSILAGTSPKSLEKRHEPIANGLHHKLPELQTHHSPASDGRARSPDDRQLPPFSALSEIADTVLSEQESNRANSFSHGHRQSVSSTGQSPTSMARQLSISSLSPGSAFPPLSASSPISGSSDVFLRSGHHTLFSTRRPSQASDTGPPYSASIHSTATNESYQSSDGLSPSSQPTPIEHRHRLASLDSALTSRTLPPPISGPNISHIPPHGSGAFKCEHPGCSAAPFQTQYLLNSHANVHSQSRPHYCPVTGCSRAEGGKGFKRKNEMIRHGLVHQSPGYVCPFCPDREHKYPRPDNLQRHVRVHHVDKDKDDPQLREVLAQRPEGGSRGRRRRTSS